VVTAHAAPGEPAPVARDVGRVLLHRVIAVELLEQIVRLHVPARID
jgi:hypothetical protein